MAKYSIGLDFGTLSGRALLVDVSTGRELATAVLEYPHAVMDEFLPDGKTRLAPDWALQHPQDYLDAVAYVIPAVLKEAGVSPADVVGVSIDFTACTLLPVLADGTPLCFLPEYQSDPNAYVKLWKHHAAQPYAERVNAKAEERGEKFLARYGGKVSSEWMLPKVWQVLDEAPEIFERADMFMEAGDWLTMQLTGKLVRNACAAGYKAMWHKKDGFPSDDFLRELDPRLVGLYATKYRGPILPVGAKAGEIDQNGAKLSGLLPGTAVGVATIDAHVAVPAAGITRSGTMLIIMGTSSCHMLLGDAEVSVPGICGVVEDGIIGGFMGYEAGQSCVGDHFDWFVKTSVPASYTAAAEAEGINIHKYLRSKAQALKPGESGLLALDWWNGNRSVLVDVDLTGMILGMTLTTKPEEIYRALIEATAFGTRKIIENFEAGGVKIDRIIAAGGIAEKDPMMMQIYSDVCGREIGISGSPQACALGSAMFGALAAGKQNGGFDTISEAAEHMSKLKDIVYRPDPENKKIYDRIYAEYELLHDYFGRGANDVMKRLKSIKKQSRGN